LYAERYFSYKNKTSLPLQLQLETPESDLFQTGGGGGGCAPVFVGFLF
jgi:hypothetical protein